MPSSGPLRIAFVHPDLGIGGAERLVVDAAVGLQDEGHVVHMYTSHHDASHCFEETRDGTLSVRVHGDFFPRHVAGRLHIVFAVLRSLYLATVLLLFGERYDVIISDQLSVSIPLLRLTGARVFFYCHHPDLMLTTRASLLKRLYRVPFDWVEEVTTGAAHRIAVNSKYTESVFREAFSSLSTLPVDVLYPPVPLRDNAGDAHAVAERAEAAAEVQQLTGGAPYFVSLNRYERKKNIGLAIRAFAWLGEDEGASDTRLVVAGGYDPRVPENIEHKQELEAIADECGVRDRVIFRTSISLAEKEVLLRDAVAIVYTPSNEHFGIVPCEAMYARTPVIAVNNGGPTESVVDGGTGYLRENTPAAFGAAMHSCVRMGAGGREAMGEKGRARVQALFSRRAFGRALDRVCRELVQE